MFRHSWSKVFMFSAAASLLIIPAGLWADDPEDQAAQEAQVEQQAEAMEQQAEQMAQQAEEMAQQAEAVAQQAEKMIQEAERQLDRMMPQLEKQVQDAMAMASRLGESIPPVPPIPPIPHIPKMPDFSHMGHEAEGEEAVETVEKAFEVQPGTALRVDSSFSSYQIQPGEDNTKIQFSIVKKAYGKTQEEARKRLPLFVITFEQTKEAVVLKIQPEEGKQEKLNGHCEVKIQLPAGTPVQIRNAFGDVNLDKLTGGVNLENKFGSAYVGHTKGNLNTVTEYGDLTIDAHEGPGKVRGQFGNVRLDGQQGDLEIQCGYGKAYVDLDSPKARLTGTFSFGDIFVALPKDYSGTIEAVSSFGEIKAPAGLEKKKEMFNESVSGSLGGGEGAVKINSSYSPVTIEMTDD